MEDYNKYLSRNAATLISKTKENPEILILERLIQEVITEIPFTEFDLGEREYAIKKLKHAKDYLKKDRNIR